MTPIPVTYALTRSQPDAASQLAEPTASIILASPPSRSRTAAAKRSPRDSLEYRVTRRGSQPVRPALGQRSADSATSLVESRAFGRTYATGAESSLPWASLLPTEHTEDVTRWVKPCQLHVKGVAASVDTIGQGQG